MLARALLTVLLMALALGVAGGAAAAPAVPSPPLDLGKGRVTFADASQVKFDAARTESGTLIYRPGGKDADETVGLDRVLRVERQTGHNGLVYALVGGASAFLGATLGANTNTQGVEVDEDTKTTVVMALTGTFTLLGYIVGAGQKRYEVEYEDLDVREAGGQRVSWRLEPGETCRLRVALSF